MLTRAALSRTRADACGAASILVVNDRHVTTDDVAILGEPGERVAAGKDDRIAVGPDHHTLERLGEVVDAAPHVAVPLIEILQFGREVTDECPLRVLDAVAAIGLPDLRVDRLEAITADVDRGVKAGARSPPSARASSWACWMADCSSL